MICMFQTSHPPLVCFYSISNFPGDPQTKMASLESAHLTSRASSQAYSTRYDNTQHFLSDSHSSVGIKPSRSNLAGSADMAAHPLSNEGPYFTRPPTATCSPPQSLPDVYASTPEDAEEGHLGKDSDTVRRVLQHLCSLCRMKNGTHAESPKGYNPFKYATLEDVERYPEGWSQISAFQNIDDRLLIFRSFNQLHCRILQNLQHEISHLERNLHNQDMLNNAGNNLRYGLRTGEGPDEFSTITNIYRELERKFQIYGMLRCNTWQGDQT
ncbi:uncharacterized protein K444DRAFT_280460 [Hyaloscypha bicolor E]|uniref:DUF6594 domain-containing protein n=1 Tax=Hyaloscypha bicolor E TaxID=1095630 RepID=A0A2J6SH13_9HELO|nr:uncharacterized protein K444DRAFT_280460 [Hyaloscypha bicolor E]PMD50062.1 hypothetical protein K444DRAFT_280460 [Hyaloscypha bicolor E]